MTARDKIALLATLSLIEAKLEGLLAQRDPERSASRPARATSVSASRASPTDDEPTQRMSTAVH